MRLIDADKLIEQIAKMDDLRKLSTKTIGKALSNCPTVEAEPVRHGKWIRVNPNDYGWYQCSECLGTTGKWNYCPYCGARMDGENNG